MERKRLVRRANSPLEESIVVCIYIKINDFDDNHDDMLWPYRNQKSRRVQPLEKFFPFEDK